MQLRLLGPMAVIADGKPLPLPASRKTRALLGYLAAEGKPVRRERLSTSSGKSPTIPRARCAGASASCAACSARRSSPTAKPPRSILTGLDIDFIDLQDAPPPTSPPPRPSSWSGSARRLPACSCATSTFPIATISTPGASPPARTARSWLDKVCAELVARDLPPDQLLPHVRAWVER